MRGSRRSRRHVTAAAAVPVTQTGAGALEPGAGTVCCSRSVAARRDSAESSEDNATRSDSSYVTPETIPFQD